MPTAPDWSAADLVEHLGQTQNWVAEPLLTRHSKHRCSTLQARKRTGGQVWLHSLLNEAVIHGFDAAAAAAGSAAAAVDTYDLDADVAAQLITNQFAMLTSPTWAAQRSTPLTRCAATGRPCTGTPSTSQSSTRPATGSSNASPTVRAGSTGTTRPT